jgi:alpha-beta hydrolase superfamily lysophospholipase
MALIDTIGRIQGAGGNVRRPMLLMHGVLDRLCPAEGSDSFYRSLPGTSDANEALSAELRIYSRSSHEIFNDVESEVVFKDLLRWIERCEADSGGVDGG